MVAETLTGAPPSAADRIACASSRRGGQARPVPDDLDGHVADAEASLCEQAARLAEQHDPACSRPARF